MTKDLEVSILADGETALAAEHAAGFERMGEVSVRGKTRPVNVFAVSADGPPHSN